MSAAAVTLEVDGIRYTLRHEPDEEGRVRISLDSTCPPLGLNPRLWEFYGRLPTEGARRQMAQAQAAAERAPLSAHDARRRRS